jgi:hypothetical protein
MAAAMALSAGVALAAQQPTAPQPSEPVPANPQPTQPSPFSQSQQPTAAPQPQAEPQQPPASATPQPAATPQVAPATSPATGPAPFVLTSPEQGNLATPVSEQDLRQQLEGKTFYLRSGYLDNPLHFDEQGHLDGHSPQGSYTLSLIEIERVKLEKHRLVLQGVRYGLHFLGALPTADQSSAIDKVRLTSKKKPLEITVDREQFVKPKKEKETKGKHGPQAHPDNAPNAAATPSSSAAIQPPPAEPTHHGAPVTTSEAHANQELAQALDRVFASGIDDRMIATLPDYWKLFYKAIAEHKDYKPNDPAVLLQNQVDQKARLISVFEPPSNEYAQNNGVAGMAMYHVVIAADGKPADIAVGRPIGFGLDENAVKSIREATFQPAMKDGKPVPVMLDLLVQFRIYSKRTAVGSNPPAAAPEPAKPQSPILPGPYTANEPRPEPQPATDSTPQPAPSQDPATPPPPTDQQPPSTTPPAQPSQQQPPPPGTPQPQSPPPSHFDPH